MTVSRTVR